jgi:FkbM family methyltransferase
MFFDLLNEERSELVFITLLKSMITGEREFCSNIMEENAFYAIPIFKTTDNEVFVDAGAYVGDTLEQFIWNNIGSFRKIYAFEPGTRQFDAMQIRVKRLVEEWAIDRDKIVCVKAGLGENNSILPFADNQTSLSSNNFVTTDDMHTSNATIYSLDSFIKDESVTMIKADIEGFEIEMLKGAKETIKRCKPKLAISIYHKPEDMFEIPMWIHDTEPEYKMAIRHHSAKLLETVLYCWI